MHLASGPALMPHSGIREIAELAWARPDAIHLEIGEPDFDTPAHISEAAIQALRDGHTHYTPSAGLPALRAGLADKIRSVNGLDADPDHVVVSNGAGQGLFATLSCLVSEGEEVLVPDPGWPNYRMMTTILGARSVGYRLRAETGYQPDLAAMEASITDRTRVILINSPSNPVGSILSVESMAAVLDLARAYDLWVIADECYDQILFDGSFTSMATLEERPERVVTVWSLSKTYAMTGWRVGYVHAPDSLVGTLRKVQEPLIACVNSAAQYAAIAAVTGPQQFVTDSVTEYRLRLDVAERTLNAAGLPMVRPSGAFYLWLPLSEQHDGADVARRLVTEHGVAVAPGPTFGPGSRHAIRISLSTSKAQLEEGLHRIVDSHLIMPADIAIHSSKSQPPPAEAQPTVVNQA